LPVRLWGGYVSIAANASDKIKLTPPVDYTCNRIIVYSTGRCRIDKIEIEGQPPFLDGSVELDQIKREGNGYDLPEPLVIAKGKPIEFSLTDISGASNLVFIGFVVAY